MTRQEMSELQRSLGRIEGKQDEILKNQERLSHIQEWHGKAISKLRLKQHWYTGGFAAASATAIYFKDAINRLMG